MEAGGGGVRVGHEGAGEFDGGGARAGRAGGGSRVGDAPFRGRLAGGGGGAIIRAAVVAVTRGLGMEALMIGVSGMRGTIGGTLTPVVVNQMARAFATSLKRTSKPANGTHFKVVFGRDSRPSGQWVAAAATAALAAS